MTVRDEAIAYTGAAEQIAALLASELDAARAEARTPHGEGVEVTEEMIARAMRAAGDGDGLSTRGDWREVLRVALSAPPAQPVQHELEEPLHNIIELARPFMRDDVQRLGLAEAEKTLAALRLSAPPASEDGSAAGSATRDAAGAGQKKSEDVCEDCGLDWCGVTCGRWPKGVVDV